MPALVRMLLECAQRTWVLISFDEQEGSVQLCWETRMLLFVEYNVSWLIVEKWRRKGICVAVSIECIMKEYRTLGFLLCNYKVKLTVLIMEVF